MDRVTREKRSGIMRAIGGRNTGPERMLAETLRGMGVPFKRYSRLPGRPDFVVPSERRVVFVDGCFWHGCPEHYREPKTNAGFWKAKVEGNRARDLRVDWELRRSGWEILRVWECEMGNGEGKIGKFFW